AWIDNLKQSELPLEYKLLDYKPERWTNLKTALFLKYMSYDLAGKDEDLEYTNARNVFTNADFEKLFPAAADSLKPIVTNDTAHPYPAKPAFDMTVPQDAWQHYFDYSKDTVTNILPKPEKDNG